MGEIGVRSYMKWDYGEINALKAAKKQSHTKPISSFCVLSSALWFCHSCGNRNPEMLTVLDSASSAE